MRMITAIVRPSRYEAVREALTGLGVQGLTVTEVKGFGRQRGRTEFYRGAEYEIIETPKLRIDVVVPVSLAEAATDAVIAAARSGKVGDGMVFTAPIYNAARIRTGEENDEALR
ncbi:MAG: P-II family nitrogen regulator [Pseudomonadota bacterium]